MKNKKGLELSLTVLVLIILSIIIFIAGIALVWKFFAGAEEIKTGIEKNTKDQIETLLRQGNELVAVPINTQQVVVGKEAVFGLGIRNIHDKKDFFIRTNFAGMYTPQGKKVAVSYDQGVIESEWLGGFQEQGPITIERNRYEIIPLRIRAASTVGQNQPTPRNTLVAFNVCVFEDNPQGDCEAGNTAVYDKIHQIVVEIK